MPHFILAVLPLVPLDILCLWQSHRIRCGLPLVNMGVAVSIESFIVCQSVNVSNSSALVFLLLLFQYGVYFIDRCYNKQRKRDKFYAALQICPFAGRYMLRESN